jgi:hypothetical protein
MSGKARSLYHDLFDAPELVRVIIPDARDWQNCHSPVALRPAASSVLQFALFNLRFEIVYALTPPRLVLTALGFASRLNGDQTCRMHYSSFSGVIGRSGMRLAVAL